MATKAKSRSWSPERRAAASEAYKARQEEMQGNVAIADRLSSEPAPTPANAVQFVEDDSKDETQLSHFHTMSDPWQGAVIEDGWHYVKVTEHHQATMGNRLKYLHMGYKMAPAMSPEILKDWDAARSWVMRLPQHIRDARVEESRRQSRENRNASMQSDNPNVIVKKAQQTKTSLAELAPEQVSKLNG